MGDLFGNYNRNFSSKKDDSISSVIECEEAYMKLLKRYLSEIHEIEAMMEAVRKERNEFYQFVLPEIKKTMEKDDVDLNVQHEWITEMQKNTEKSFQISESLIQHYITKNLDEFKHEINELINRI